MLTRKFLATAATLAAVAASITTGAPAPAVGSHHTRGHEAFHGFLVSNGVSGDREVTLTRIAAHGVFDGVGSIVEVASQPGDPDNVSRDDLVFPAGSMHLVSTSHSVKITLEDPAVCRIRADIEQTGEVIGGTGLFRDAHGRFRGGVRAFATAARAPDGSCDQDAAPVSEVDFVWGKGYLSY